MTVATSARFWDWIAARYSRKPVADEAAYQRKLQVTRDYLRPHMQVLEIGCGTGSTAIAHAPHVSHVHATDISKKMLEIAKAKATAAQVTNISFEQGSVDDLDVPDQSVDVVLALSLLHLLEDRDRAIAKVRDMLRPGGLFVTNTVCLGDFMKFFRYVAPLGRWLGLLPLVRVFTRAELEQSLAAAGFENDYVWQPESGRVVFVVSRKAAHD